MKRKKFLMILSLFSLLLVTCIFISGGADASNTSGITPQKMYASGKLFDYYYCPLVNGTGGAYNWLAEFGNEAYSQGQLIGQVNISMEFWNVGAKGNGKFDKATYGLTSADYYGFGTVKIKTTYEGEPTGGPGEVNNFEWLGNFTGGPDGVIEPDWYSSDLYVDKWPIGNGTVILISFKGDPVPSQADIPIKNPEAFYDQTTPPEATSSDAETIADQDSSDTLIEEKPQAPSIKLKLRGPFESGGNENTFIIDAAVSGYPEPDVIFSRDDSGGNLGKYKAMINMAPDSEITVSAIARNASGEASDQINISTKKQPPSLQLKILEGPVWYNIESAYYIVEAEVKGFPEPYVVWENPSRTEFLPAGKNKKYVYVREGHFQNVTITAYASNSLGKSEKQSVNLSWVNPPADLFTKRAQIIFKNSAMKGHLSIKRAGDRTWSEVNEVLTLYEGDTVKTDKSGAIVITTDLKGWMVLGVDSEFIVVKDEDGKNMIIRQGSARFNFTNPKDNSGNSLSIYGKYGNAKITGTDFVIISDENQSVLKVIDGTVEFTSTVSDESITINSGESIIATDKGLGVKTTFDVASEEKYWDDLSANLEPANANDTSSPGSNTDTLIIVIIVIEALVLLGVLAGGYLILKKYKIL